MDFFQIYSFPRKKHKINPTNKLFTKPQNSNRNITTLAIHLLYAAIIMIFEDYNINAHSNCQGHAL